MTEHFGFDAAAFCNKADLIQRQLPGEHHPGKAHLFAGNGPRQIMDGHLGGGMHRQIGGQSPHHAHYAQILDDDGAGALPVQRSDEGSGLLQFPVGEKGVHRHIGVHAPQAAIAQKLGELFSGNVLGAAPGVKIPGAEINGVGAAGNGGHGRFQRTGRAHQLQSHGFFLLCLVCFLGVSGYPRFSRASSARREAASSAYSRIWLRRLSEEAWAL